MEFTSPRDPSRPAATARWDWIPATTGDVVLVARAFDSTGHASQSSPIRIHVVTAPPVTYRLIEVAADGGESLASIVAANGGDPSVASYWNGALPDDSLPAGTTVAVPVRDPTPPPPSASLPAGTPGLADAVLAADLAHPVPAGLETPSLELTVKGCTITGKTTGGTNATTGFSYSVLPPASNSFLHLPSTGGSGGGATTTFYALGGRNYVTVSEFSRDAGTPSAIVPVDVPRECGAGRWSGTARLDGGQLVTDQAVDRAYLYLRAGAGDWQRVPTSADSFVEATDGVLDFRPVLPAVMNADLALEAWGWRGGTLVNLGSGTYVPPAGSLYLGAAGDAAKLAAGLGTSLDIQIHAGTPEFHEVLSRDSTIDRPGPNSTSASRTFKWSTTDGGVTGLQWQLLPYPVTNSTVTTPPFLLDTGTIDVHGLSTGTFSIDLKPYLGGKTAGVTSASAWGQNQLITKLTQIAASEAAGGPAAASQVVLNQNGIWRPSPTPSAGSGAIGGGTSGLTIGSADSLSQLPLTINALYLRVIPYAGTTPAGDASNLVSLKVVEPDDPLYFDTSPPPPAPMYNDAYTQHAIFYAPTGSNPHAFHCVRVVKGGFSVPIWGDWTDGTTHCRPEDDGGWSLSDAFEAFVDWVGGIWDWVSDAYGWVEDQVVNVVLALVPCQQIADQVSDSGKEICKTIAKTGLQAVMVSFGIPPEIPNWESTISAAKGDLKDFVLENADQLPGVSEACAAATAAHAAKGSFPTCDALVEKVIAEATSRIAAQRSSAAAANAGVLVPDGVTVEPDPRGMPQPPHFDITLTRTNAALPTGVDCTMTGSMTSTLDDWNWDEWKWMNGRGTFTTKSGTVTGEPFTRVTQDIARLAPGESVTYQLWLTKKTMWFEPDGLNDFYAKQYALGNGDINHDWVLLQKGATVVGRLAGNCIPGGTLTQVLDGQASD